MNTNDIEALTSQAEKAEADGDLELALDLWKSLSRRVPSHYFYFIRYASIAQDLERWQDAEEAYLKAVALEPSALVLESIGRLWYERKDKEERYAREVARDWLLRSLALERNARTLSTLACVYGDLKETESAIVVLEEAITLDDSYEEAIYNLGFLLEKTQPERALKLQERVLELDPMYGPPHQSLGRIVERMGDFVRAEYHFRRCLEIDPSDYGSALFLANALAKQERNDEADVAYKRALPLAQGLELGYRFYANFLESIGEDEKAAEVRTQISEASFFQD